MSLEARDRQGVLSILERLELTTADKSTFLTYLDSGNEKLICDQLVNCSQTLLA